MIRNYIKTAYRSLLKNKSFTAINVLGLAIGLATCMLIAFYVVDELSFDQYNLNADRIYRVNNDIKLGDNASSYATSPAVLAPTLKSNFPEVEQTVRFLDRGGTMVRKGSQNIYEERMIHADPSLFDVFTLPVIEGDASSALVQPHCVVITEAIAQKYFNTTAAVGRVLTFNDTAQYKITAVIKNVPQQSHFNFDFFISMSTLAESTENNWLANHYNTYLLLKHGTNAANLEAKLPGLVARNAADQLTRTFNGSLSKLKQRGDYFKFNLTPLKQIHLQSNRVGELGTNGNLQSVFLFAAIGIFILLIACVNFMNLSTARSANRAREVGVRKVLGSSRKYLIAQFLSESLMVTLAATIIAVIAAWALLPLFKQLSGKEFIISSYLLVRLIPALVLVVLLVGGLAGAYPAFFLSAFKPVDVLKGKIAGGFKGGRLRSFLVVFQFAVSVFLIIGTLVIYGQLKFIQNKDVGFNRDQVLLIRNGRFLGSRAKSFKQEIKQMQGVENATLSNFFPVTMARRSAILFKDPVQKEALTAQEWTVDEDYVNTVGIQVLAGRDFSNQLSSDSTAIIINQTAAKQLSLANPINHNLYEGGKQYHIIGVIKDFNFTSLRDNVTPLTLKLAENRGKMAVRIHSANMPLLISQIANKWADSAPGQPFTYTFMDQDFDALYRSEQRTGKLFITFSTLAIAIACLGLFGLAAYAAEQRTKEIGIRKVLGAGVSSIVQLLSLEFIKLVFIAILVATPIAWFMMNKWLQDFAYRITLTGWIPAAAGLIAVVIAFLTIGFQSVKAANANPVKSLRSD